MARLARAEVFAPDEVAVAHVMNRVVRRCYLLGNDPVSGKNYDHRKHTGKFLRHHRFVLGEKIQRTLYHLLEIRIRAKSAKD